MSETTNRKGKISFTEPDDTVSHVVYFDFNKGCDETGEMNNADRPFKTVTECMFHALLFLYTLDNHNHVGGEMQC